jgi:hypothetical protein
MLVAAPAVVVADLAGNKTHVPKFLVPLCLPVNQEQHCDRLLPRDVALELGVRFAVKASAFRVSAVNFNSQ